MDFQNQTPRQREVATTTIPTVEVPVNVNTVPVKTDAANRAVRTLVQNLTADVLAAVGAVAVLQSNDIHWTKGWWAATIVLMGKTAGATAFSYIGRFMAKPKGAISK